MERAWLAVLALAAATWPAAHPEKTVVDQYFNAVNAKDNQTLSSFAAVQLRPDGRELGDQEDDSEEKEPAPLPELVTEGEGRWRPQQAANTKAARAYSLDHFADIDAGARTPKAERPVPAKLRARGQPSGTSSTRRTASSRRRWPRPRTRWRRRSATCALLGGRVEDVEALPGEVHDQEDRGGPHHRRPEPQPYVMTLRKYELKRDGPARQAAGWSRPPAQRLRRFAAQTQLRARRSGPPGAWRRCPGTTPSASGRRRPLRCAPPCPRRTAGWRTRAPGPQLLQARPAAGGDHRVGRGRALAGPRAARRIEGAAGASPSLARSRSTRSRGISVRKRLGSARRRCPNTCRLCAQVRCSRSHGPGHADVAQPALLLEGLGAGQAARVGRRAPPPARPGRPRRTPAPWRSAGS